MKERPIGVTILAILAGVAAVLAAIHALQFLGIFPFVVGPSGVYPCPYRILDWWPRFIPIGRPRIGEDIKQYDIQAHSEWLRCAN